jgi:phage terminase large subunit GpA-like protein
VSNLADGHAAVLAAIARGLKPDPDLPVDQWADEHMFIPADTGAKEYGRYRSSRTPHARAIMQALSPGHPCKRVVAQIASQMFKTQSALNFLGASIHQAPSNFLWIVPTGTLVKRASVRIDKTVRVVPVLAERIAPKRSRDASNNITTKEYPGGTLHILTAGAAANLSEVAARYIVFDEIDRAEENVGSEGDPGALAEARQTTFESNRKAYYPSSPTLDGESAIQRLYDAGTRREALAECVHCGRLQPLEFERLIRSESGNDALYPCVDCGALHSEIDKTKMFARGAWSEGVPGDGETESFTASQMFLPYGWLPWIALMRLYDRAKAEKEKGNDAEMTVFYNTRLARCWSPTREKTRHDELMSRAEPYKLGTVPSGALVLTASVDTQNNRLELKVVGWGPGMEAWVVDYQVILSAPSERHTWEKLDAMLQSTYMHESGVAMQVQVCFVDSGGSATTDVYAFTYARQRRNIYAIKGASRPNRPILSSKPTLVDVSGRGKVEKGGAKLWLIGTDTAKDYLAARWKRSSGPGAVHFSEDLEEEYFKQLTAEYRHKVKRGTKYVTVWDKRQGDANEAGDLMVYNIAAAHFLGLHKCTDAHWEKLRAKVLREPVALSAPEETAEVVPSKPALPVQPLVGRIRRGKFGKGGGWG